jgi:uncharacterized membrane protein YgcG
MRPVRLALAAAAVFLGLAPSLALAAGPPYPDPVSGIAVYDTADVLSQATEAQLEASIDKVEADTGAEVVVYTQLIPRPETNGDAQVRAAALMDQWGVGRAGVNDGLVILIDLNQGDTCHGQVAMYGGEGYNNTWLSVDDRQRIFENDMLPYLKACDMDGAVRVAIEKVQGASGGRVVNAVIGLILAPAILLLTILGSLYQWLRTGKDPVYLDDDSILVPAPPPGLTPAAGAALREGSVTRRALTTASLDLAARGRIAFQSIPSTSLLGGEPDLGIFTRDSAPTDPVEQARLDRVRRRPSDEATQFLLKRLRTIGGGIGYVKPEDLLDLGKDVGGFQKRLETHLVEQGWFKESPGEVSGRWSGRGVLAFIGAVIAVIAGFNLPSSGLVLVAVALLVSSIWLFGIAGAMPSKTLDGARVVAMLEAYRRTLTRTMAQARSMGQVVEEAALPLIEDPDDAVVWGVALGLQESVEEVLQRSAEDLSTGRATSPYMPLWYSSGAAWGHGGDAGGGWAPGMMSSSPIPNFGGMMAALGTIGNSPASSSSGGGGGGGFSGGSSGGGGGAGGGF